MTVRRGAALLIAVASAFVCVAEFRVSGYQETPEQSAPPRDEKADQALLDSVCGSCHESSVVAGPFRTAEEWDEAISRMQSYGLSAPAEQLEQIRTHLLRTYGRANVNSAPAKDLAPVLDVVAATAEAVVGYRKQNGAFKTLDDLKKVPGLDAAQVDARKARLAF